MENMEPNSIDSIVTDPPYGISFMGKDWDHGVPGVHFWQSALRVAKPGAHLLAFGGTRTFHRLAVAIEDAGWEIRDTVMWVYGSGFPKSMNVAKAIQAKETIGSCSMSDQRRAVMGENYVESDTVGHTRTGTERAMNCKRANPPAITNELTDSAKQWDGWGTALKPSWEPVIVARNPLEGTVAENVLKWGTGAINIDGSRVGVNPGYKYNSDKNGTTESTKGRWPANLIHDGCPEVVGLFPDRKTTWVSSNHANNRRGDFLGKLNRPGEQGFNDTGSAARFFYCAKTSASDRNEGCDNIQATTTLIGAAGHKINPVTGLPVVDVPPRNIHPTVKPTDLMRYLCRLVTPPGGIVYDPFMGSGSTGKAALLEGFDFIGSEIERQYFVIARERLHSVIKERK